MKMLFILVVCSALELIKRPIFILIYPIAYWRRSWPRQGKGLLWLALDDSIVVDGLALSAGVLEYCSYGKREPLNFITEQLPAGRFREFMRAWNWGAWRNNSINLMILLERKIGVITEIMYNPRRIIERRRFRCGWTLPYFERNICGWKLQAGFLTCGRWQLQIKRQEKK